LSTAITDGLEKEPLEPEPKRNMTESEEEREALQQASDLATWNEATWEKKHNEKGQVISVCTNLGEKISDNDPLPKWMSRIGGFVCVASSVYTSMW
jgi:hypothetical protein